MGSDFISTFLSLRKAFFSLSASSRIPRETDTSVGDHGLSSGMSSFVPASLAVGQYPSVYLGPSLCLSIIYSLLPLPRLPVPLFSSVLFFFICLSVSRLYTGWLACAVDTLHEDGETETP